MKLTDTNPIRNKETKSMKDYKGKDISGPQRAC